MRSALPALARSPGLLILGLRLVSPGDAAAEVWGLAQARYGVDIQAEAPGCPPERCARLDGDHLLSLGTRTPGQAGLWGEAQLAYRFQALEAVPRRAVDTYGPLGDLRILSLQLGYQLPRQGLEGVVGRQGRWDADPITFDGGSLSWTPAPLSQRLTVSAWGGAYVDPAADAWEDRLLGALFPQAAAGVTPPAGVPVGGVSAILRPGPRDRIEVSDTLLLGSHLSRLEGHHQWASLTLSAGARGVDAALRDAWMNVTHVHAAEGQVLSATLTRAGAQPFALGPADGVATAASRLRIGAVRPHWRLDAQLQRPVGPLVLDTALSGMWMVDREAQDGLQRDTLYGRLGLSWARGGFQVSTAAFGLTQPGVGRFGGRPLPADRAGEPPLFADLSGEGIGALSGLSLTVGQRIGPTLRASAAGDLLVIHGYTTQFLTVAGWEALSTSARVEWRPTSWLSLSTWAGVEQDLHAAFGITSLHRRVSLALTARW